MFKKNILKYILIAFSAVVLFLTGCEGANPVKSITIENQNVEEPITFVVGEFSFDDVKLVVSYENGETKVVSINESMINKDDLIKLYKLGNNEIEVIYERQKTTMYVYGTYKKFTDLYLNDVEMTYTGEEIRVEVEGNIPDTAQIIYPQGNVYKNVGTYVTKAIVFENGYEVLELTANVTINKATYDMSSIEFNSTSYTYDGKNKMLSIIGNLPEGVTVSYYINDLVTTGVTNSGEYEVKAVFSGDGKNYEPIDDMVATLTINKASHNMDGIRFEDVEFVYDSNPHEIKITNEVLLPSGVQVVYKNNKQTDAGTYEAVVEFELDDPNNYEAIEPMKAILKINKAEYDLSEYYLVSQKVKYDREVEFELSFNQELPNFISVQYQFFPQLVKGNWSTLNIDATSGHWYRIDDYISVGKGTKITIEVFNRTEIALEVVNDVNNFDISVENGIATITCLNEDGLKSIQAFVPSDESNSITYNVTMCDLIFHNEEEPLPSDVLPSLRGEYIVFAKLTVEDKNYSGEKELIAILIIE